MPLVPDPKNCDISVKRAIQGLSKKLGYTSSPVFNNINITNVVTASSSVFSETCTVAAGLNVLRVTGLQTDDTAMTGTLRGAYIDVSNGSTAATGTIRAMELKARTEAPGDTGNNVNVLEGLSISADSKGHSVTTMRAAEFILDGSTGGTITEAVGLRIANNLQANKATASYGLQIYRDSFDYTYDITLSLGGHITGDSYVNQDLRTTASPTFAGLTLTNAAVIGSNSVVFQPDTDSTTFFQVLDADGGTSIFNVDTINERVGIGTDSPGSLLHINSAGVVSTTLLTLESDINNTNEYNEILFKVVGGQNYGAIRSCIGGIAGDSYMSLFTTTDGGTLVRQVTIQHDGRVGFGTYNPETLLEMVSTAPYVTLYNLTEEDTDGGGESRIIGKREDGAGTGTAAGQIEISHDGSGANDQFGKIILSVNTGAGLAQALEIGSDLLATFGGAVNITTIAAEGSDVDKFLVDSTGVIKYRTGAQVLSDIGGQASGSYITALTGEVTASGPGSVAATITNDAVTYAKMQNVSATDKVLGRVTAGAGDVEEIACTAAGRAILDDADASAQRTTLGLAIGTNVQAWDAQLDDLATISATAAGIDSHLGGHSDTVLWSEVDKTTSSIADITTKNHTDLTAGDGSDHTFIDQSVVIAGTPTFAGIIIADGGTVGQAAGPLLTFSDTSDYLRLTGARLEIANAVRGAFSPCFSVSANRGDAVDCWFQFSRAEGGDNPITDGHGPSFVFESSRGTLAVPIAIKDGDELGSFTFCGYDGTAWMAHGTRIQGRATGDWTTVSNPAAICFLTMSSGSVGFPIERMRISDSGAVTMTSTLGVTGAITASNYTAANLLTACATNAGALDFSAASKTLTVENNTTVSQDYSSDASPTFANLSIGTGELTCGSINRASGTLTLEIGGTAELSITSTATTFGGNLIIPNNGTIGQVAGPLLTFDDTNNYLEITGCNVGIGTNTPVGKLEIQQAQNTDAATFTNPHLKITDSATTNSGGTTAIILATSSVADNYGVSLAGVRYTTSGNPEFSIRLHSGTAAGTEVFRILTDGGILMPNLKSGTDQANAGAAANELYRDTDDGNTIKMGV